MAQITVPHSDGLISYNLMAAGAPAGTVLSFNFPIFALSDIEVTFIRPDGSIGTLPADPYYTVNGVAADDGYSSGNITLDEAIDQCHLTIARNAPIEKLQNWPTTGAFSIYAENTLWSKHTAWHQEHRRGLKAALRGPVGDILQPLPGAVARAGRILSFDAGGQPLLVEGDLPAIIADIQADADAAAASAAAASASASAAAISQGAAASSVTAAAAAADNAADSATDADASATAAANSAVAASTHATNAAASAAAAAASAASVGQPATETVMGIAEVATTAEVTAGTDDARFITPFKLAQRIATLPVAGAASETVAGLAELATQAETNAGTDDLRIVTPLKLKQFTGRIDGPVGIGVAPSGANLHVKGATSAQAVIEGGGAANSALQLKNTVRSWQIITDSTGVLTLYDDTAPGARLNIGLSGQVGLGIAPNADPLIRLHIYNAGKNQLVIESSSTNQAELDLKNSARTIGWYLDTSGNLGLYDYTNSILVARFDQTTGKFWCKGGSANIGSL